MSKKRNVLGCLDTTVDKSVEKLSGGGCGDPGGGFGGPGGGFSDSRSSGKPLLLLRLKNHPRTTNTTTRPPQPLPDSFSTDLSTVVSTQPNRSPIGVSKWQIRKLGPQIRTPEGILEQFFSEKFVL